MSERFVNTLSCRDCGAPVMLSDVIHTNGVCFRCTDVVAKPYKSDHCKDCGVQMHPDPSASELVCPRCGRVEEAFFAKICASTRSFRIKDENVYLKKQVMKFFRNYNVNVPDELIRQVEVVYISLQDFYLTVTRPGLTFLILIFISFICFLQTFTDDKKLN